MYRSLLSIVHLFKFCTRKNIHTPSFPVRPSTVLYGCKTWSLIFTEKRRLRLFEKRVLRRIFGPKMEKGNRGVKKTT